MRSVSSPLCLALLTLTALLALARAPQHPEASVTTLPSSCNPGDKVYLIGTGYEWCTAANTWTLHSVSGNAFPSGLVVMTLSASGCPSGFTQLNSLNGQMIYGTEQANGDVDTTGGSASITPAGSNSAPALSMNSYTPAGSNSAPTFIGTQDTTSAVSAGTPAGTNSTASFTPAGTNGTASFSATGVDIGTTTTSHTISVFNGTTIASGSNTLSVPAEVFTGAAGTVPAETFTGTALGTHTHTVTPTGTVSAPTFTGTPATLTGSVSAPAFTGTAFDPHPPYTKVIFCQAN
jgi:hypothetical protein